MLFLECNSFGITYSISFLDGLDITKQKFTGEIKKKGVVISSQGALNYEGINIKENPNGTYTSGSGKWKYKVV